VFLPSELLHCSIAPLFIVATSDSSFLLVYRRQTFNFSEPVGVRIALSKNSGGEKAKISIEGSNK